MSRYHWSIKSHYILTDVTQRCTQYIVRSNLSNHQPASCLKQPRARVTLPPSHRWESTRFTDIDICRARHVNNKLLREQVLIWRNVIGLCHLVYSKGISYPRSSFIAMIAVANICFLWKQILRCWRYFSNHNCASVIDKSFE